MVPDGVRVVSALHTVSAADAAATSTTRSTRTCSSAATTARTRSASSALIDRIAGPARRRRRAPGDGAHRRVADRAADLDQRAPQDARRDPDHRSLTAVVVVLAGGTGGAKLARGMLDVVGDELVVVANTADDVEVYGAYVSPDPDLCAFWLADRIDERGWGLRGDTLQRDGPAARARRRRLVQPRRPRPRDRPAPRAAPGRGRHAHRGDRRARRAALGVRARVLPMADEPVRTRVLARGRWVAFQEFMIRERGEGPGRRRRARRGSRRRARRRRCSTRSPARARSSSARRTRSSRSARSSRCPGIGDALRAARGAGRRRLAHRRRRGAQGPDRGLHGVGRPARERGRDGAAPTTGCSTAWWPTSPSTACPRSQTDTLMADAAARRRVGRGRPALRGESVGDEDAAPSCRSSASTTPSSAWTRRSTPAPAARWPRRWSPTCCTRCAAPSAIDKVVVVTGENGAEALARAYDAESIADDDRGHSHAARAGVDWALRARLRARAARRPATARRSTRASSTSCWPAR